MIGWDGRAAYIGCIMPTDFQSLGETSETTMPANSASAPVTPDKLTIARLLILTAGVAAGLRLFALDVASLDTFDAWRTVASAVLAGLSLPGPLFILRWRRRMPVGLGGLLWLALGLGVWTMVPPALAVPLDDASARTCLFIGMPLASLWFMSALLLSGQLRRGIFSRFEPWTERFGLGLGLAWSPLGIGWLFDIYGEAFF